MNDYAQLRLLPGLVTRLKTLAPQVTLEVRPDEGASIPAQLASGELDLAIDYLYFEQLDQPLFRRTAKGLEPTAAALALYVPVRQALHLLQAGLGSQETFDPHTA
ncbi:LysR substrate-binding domain-containing protein, partial [Klebsiella pneumoniae subsp. pneumoniae]